MSRFRLMAAVVGVAGFLALSESASAAWRNSLKPKGKAAASLTLSTDGKTDYVIVIPSRPTPQDRRAAEELALWLGEMTGAEFPIVTDSETPRETEISVGKTNRLAEADVPQANADLAAEGYAIGVVGKRLFLVGGRKRGALNAVFALLEEDLGCRWYPTLDVEPGENGGSPVADPKCNRIPQTPSLQFRPVPRSYAPLFIYRAPGYTNAYEVDWALRNRTWDGSSKIPDELGGNLNWMGLCHEMGRLVPASEYFEKHPEWHALIDGKRSPQQLCMTNPEVVKVLTKELLKRLREAPDADFADVSPNDGGGHCACPKCDAINKENGSPSASQIYFVNKVAEEVSKEFPHIRISSAAYLDSNSPPTKIRCHKNVSVFLANDAHSWVKPLIPFTKPGASSERYRKAIEGWTSICDTVLVWDYFCNFQHYLTPMPNLHVLEPSIRYYAKHKIRGIQMQGIGYHAAGDFSALRTWVIAKALWDPSLSVDALIDDFIWGYYDEAAPAIIEYRALLDRIATPQRNQTNSICFSMDRNYPNAPFLTREFLDKATAIFNRELAKSSLPSDIRRRVEVAKLPLTYVKLCKGGEGTDEPWVFRTDEDYSVLLADFKKMVEREKISHYAEGRPMPGWLACQEALYGRLPENVVYDLYKNIGEAKTETCRMFKRDFFMTQDAVDDGKDEREGFAVIVQHPPEEGVANATFEIALPDLQKGKKLVLQFATCFTQPTANGVGFTVLVNDKELWSEEQKERPPVKRRVDLSGWAGQTIALTLRTDALGNGAYDWSCWVLPQVAFIDAVAARPGFESLTPLGKNAQGYREWKHAATGIVLVELPGGDFDMGSPEAEEGRGAGELLHRVTLSPFLIGKYEVTQAQYEAVMEANPSHFRGVPQRPVEGVSWSQLHNPGSFLQETGFWLPSEAQWEYACRAGHPGPYSGTGNLDDMGWYSDNSDTGNGRETHRVGLKLPNQFGLHDMHGNVFEWVEDSSEPNFYSHPEAAGPDPVHRGPPDCAFEDPPCASGETCNAPFCASYRGGNFSLNRSSNIENSSFCRSGHRGGNSPDMASEDVGFRVVLSAAL